MVKILAMTSGGKEKRGCVVRGNSTNSSKVEPSFNKFGQCILRVSLTDVLEHYNAQHNNSVCHTDTWYRCSPLTIYVDKMTS